MGGCHQNDCFLKISSTLKLLQNFSINHTFVRPYIYSNCANCPIVHGTVPYPNWLIQVSLYLISYPKTGLVSWLSGQRQLPNHLVLIPGKPCWKTRTDSCAWYSDLRTHATAVRGKIARERDGRGKGMKEQWRMEWRYTNYVRGRRVNPVSLYANF